MAVALRLTETPHNQTLDSDEPAGESEAWNRASCGDVGMSKDEEKPTKRGRVRPRAVTSASGLVLSLLSPDIPRLPISAAIGRKGL